MTEQEARDTLAEAVRYIDWENVGGIINNLTEYNWGRYNNQVWRWNYKQAYEDISWLEKNFDRVIEAVKVLKSLGKNGTGK